jgi:hypothetical protein
MKLVLHPGHLVLQFFGNGFIIVPIDKAHLGLPLRAVVSEVSGLVALETQLVLLWLAWLGLDGSSSG